MGIQGNSFELLGLDDGGDDLESLIARAGGVKIDEEKGPTTDQIKKPMPRPPSSGQPPRFSSDRRARTERGGDNAYGSEGPRRNGLRYNGHYNGSQQNNGSAISFRRNNGFRQENGQGDGLKHFGRRDFDRRDGNGFQKDEGGETGGDVRPNMGRPYPNRRNYHQQQKDQVDSAGDEIDANQQAPRQGNGFRRERFFGQRRGYNRDHHDGQNEEIVENKQESERQGHEGGNIESVNKSNDYKDERRYRGRNWNSGGDLRDNGSFRGGFRRGGSNEGKTGWVRRGDRGGYQGSGNEQPSEQKNEGKTYESKDCLNEKGLEKDSGVGDSNNGVHGDAVNVKASKETGSKRWKREKDLTPEELAAKLAEEEAEAKKMTLKEYEKHLQEKRKALEPLKTEERKVTPDKEFESMVIIKKNEESVFVKLGNDSDKLKKKISAEKDDNTTVKALIPNFKHADTNYPTERRGGRNQGPEENAAGVNSGRGDRGGYGNGYVRQTRRANPPPSIEDANQFPALGGPAKV